MFGKTEFGFKGGATVWKHRVPKELAERVVQLLHGVTGNNVNFMGANGKEIFPKHMQNAGGYVRTFLN